MSVQNVQFDYDIVRFNNEAIVQYFTQLSGLADFLCPFIWSRVSGLLRFCNGLNKETALNFVQISGKVRRPWQYLGKRLGKKAQAVYGKFKHTETKKGETGEDQSQEHDRHFL
jgi:hypothetical protein